MDDYGGWSVYNQERKRDGLQPIPLDPDSFEHIQIITDLARKHAEKFGPL